MRTPCPPHSLPEHPQDTLLLHEVGPSFPSQEADKGKLAGSPEEGGGSIYLSGEGEGALASVASPTTARVLRLQVQNDLMRGTKPTSGFLLASDTGPR